MIFLNSKHYRKQELVTFKRQKLITFQRQKPKRVWNVKKEKVNEEKLTNQSVSKDQTTKAQMFYEKIQKMKEF